MGTLHRLRFEVVLAIVSSVLGVLTVAAPHWLEAVSGLDPDGHSGVLEWAAAALLMLIALVAALLARENYRRLLAQRDS